MDVFELFKILYLTTGFLPLLVYLIRMKGSRVNKSIVNFLPFIVLIFFATFVETIVKKFIFKYNSLAWFRLYDFLEFYCILLFYYFELNRKKIYYLFAISYLILFFYLSINWNNENVGDQPLIIYSAVLVLISTILWFVNVFNNFEETPLYKRSGFFLNSVLLIYIIGTTLTFISIDFVWKNEFDNLIILNTIVKIFNIITRLLIIVTLLKFLKFDRSESKF